MKKIMTDFGTLLIFSTVLFSLFAKAQQSDFKIGSSETEIEIAIAHDLILRPAFREEQGVDGSGCDIWKPLANKGISAADKILIRCRVGKTGKITDMDALRYFELNFNDCISNNGNLSINPNNLSNAERFALCFYSDHGSDILNYGFKNSSGEQVFLKNIQASLNSALSKLPSYVGQVTRMVGVISDLAANYKVGQELSFASYLSTSYENLFKGSTRYVIISKNCKDIHVYSGLPNEAEVLCPRNSSFIIKQINLSGNGGIAEIYLDEI